MKNVSICFFLFFWSLISMSQPPRKFGLTPEQASGFAKLALKGIQKEYPNKLDHVMNDPSEVCSPKALHPAFYGCFDWHSSVHGHWMLVKLLKTFPDLPEGKEIRRVLEENLSEKNILVEVAYLKRPNRQSFERTYGWAWLLKLAQELHEWKDEQGQKWSRHLSPLAQEMADRYLRFLPRQLYPIRTGVHPNTAFGLAFALDYARSTGHGELEKIVTERSLFYFLGDTDYPAAWEPGGEDFFSPALMEADLMSRVLPADRFREWLGAFLPALEKGGLQKLLTPAQVTDRSDPKIVHLDGLNFSRAWCMRHIADRLPPSDPSREALAKAAQRHAQASLPHVASGEYVGEHWLASFAVYMLASPDPE